MNMAEHLDLHADWLEREAEAQDEQEFEIETACRDAWDQCLKQRNIDAEIGGGYYSDLIEVLDDACGFGDPVIHRTLMQALVHCAAKGQVEAIEALDMVKDHFVTKTMEFHK